MKKSRNIIVLLLALTVVLTVVLNASWMGNIANDRVSFLSDDDPNEPEMQGALIQSHINCLSDDPNEPEFAGALSGTLLGQPDDDPNEPELL
jgi:hypothetical protein